MRLCDFGFARAVAADGTGEDDPQAALATAAGEASPADGRGSYLGTPGYLAPEIRMGRPQDTAVDVWSLGVLAYLLLVGELPFDPRRDVLPLELPGERLPIKQYLASFDGPAWAAVSSPAKEVVWRMLQVDPSLRCSAREVARHGWVAGRSSPDLD